MLGTYYYNEIFRKTVVAFGTVFNNFDIRHQDSSGNVTSIIKVPLIICSNTKVSGKNRATGRY